MKEKVNFFNVFADSEFSYWEVEFEAIVFRKDKNSKKMLFSLIEKGMTPIIQVSDFDNNVELLSSLPHASVCIHLNSDETYDPYLNRKIISHPSVKFILRSYPVPNFKLGNLWFTFLGILVSSSLHKREKSVLGMWLLLIFGLVMAKRQAVIRLLEKLYSKESIHVPLGYTDNFYNNYCDFLNVELGSSFFKDEILPKLDRSKVFDFGFTGQRGNTFRQYLMNLCVETDSSKCNIEIKEHFGGNIDKERQYELGRFTYVEVLFKSKFSICPPGNYSGYTFRFSEAIACGSLPLDFSCIPSDPFFQGQRNWAKSDLKAYKAKKFLKYCLTLGDDDIAELTSFERKKYYESIRNAKKEIYWQMMGNQRQGIYRLQP